MFVGLHGYSCCKTVKVSWGFMVLRVVREINQGFRVIG
jgi:hypothetical protein